MNRPANYGLSLPGVYLVWLCVVLALYPPAAGSPLSNSIAASGGEAIFERGLHVAVPAAAQEEIERLRGQLDALKNDVKELTEAQFQAAHTIATMKAAEEDLRREVPPPYWYSNPATWDLALANQPQWAGVVPPPRRPATARSESRGLRKGGGAAPASPASPQ
jgi:hypothetical protein